MPKVYYKSPNVRGFNLNEPTLCFSHLHNYMYRAVKKGVKEGVLEESATDSQIHFNYKGKEYTSVRDFSSFTEYCYLLCHQYKEAEISTNIVCIRMFNELSGMYYSKNQIGRSWTRKNVVKPIFSTK